MVMVECPFSASVPHGKLTGYSRVRHQHKSRTHLAHIGVFRGMQWSNPVKKAEIPLFVPGK